MRTIFAGLITLYQKAVSPFLPQSCRFYPTCSDYAKQAVLKYGVLKGGFMSMKRVLRCNPLSKGGIDKVE